MGKGKGPAATPRAPVVEEQHIHSRTAEILRQVQVALVSGEAVEQDHGRVWAPARSEIEEAIQSQPLALEGELLTLGADESYIYTFSGKPPLRGLGFWSLTVYDGDGYLIPNPRNASSLGDRSNITYPSGDAVYGSDSDTEQDGEFQLLIQPADVSPPANWTGNWLPGPIGGGNMTSLLRFYDAVDDLLDGTYRYPVVTKQQAVV